MSCAPSADLVLAHVGALRLGAIVVPVNTAFGPNELGNVWSEARPKLAVLDDPARLPDVPSAPASLEGLDAKAACRARCVCRRRPRDAHVHLGHDRPAEGSDPQSRQRARRACEGVHVAWRWTPDDRLVLTLPLFHMHGLGVGVHGTLARPERAWRSRRSAPTACSTLPPRSGRRCSSGCRRCTSASRRSERVGELAALRLCVSGSAALAADVWRALAERGGQRVIERYGMTETFMNTSNTL